MWQRSLKLLDLSDSGGVLMSMEMGPSSIGSTTGLAMAASEEIAPVPSVEEPEGADIPTKKES